MLTHLIVDGYNVLYAWREGQGRGPQMDRARPVRYPVARGAMSHGARADLLRALELAAATHGIRCTVVFDGMPIDDLTHASSQHLTVLFAGPRDTADTLIERLVCRQQAADGIVVVTGDRTHGNLVVGWGARVWSPAMLADWVRDAG